MAKKSNAPGSNIVEPYTAEQENAYDLKYYFEALSNFNAARRAMRDPGAAGNYRRARADDALFHGSEIVGLEMHARSASVRRLCTTAIEAHDIDRDWPLPDDYEDDDIILPAAVLKARAEQADFAALFMAECENGLIEVKSALSTPGLRKDRREALEKAYWRHAHGLDWLVVYAAGAARKACLKIMKVHKINPAEARVRHKI